MYLQVAFILYALFRLLNSKRHDKKEFFASSSTQRKNQAIFETFRKGIRNAFNNRTKERGQKKFMAPEIFFQRKRDKPCTYKNRVYF